MKKQDMLKSVSNYLSNFGQVNEEILEAIDKTDRKKFMPPEIQYRAYSDLAIPIGNSQTISQPSTVARMLQLLELKKGDNVLEIGTGSGWNAALIDFLVGPSGSVLSLEIITELAEKAKKNLKTQKLENIIVKQGDFLKLKQRFDKIIFTAGISYTQEERIEDFATEHLKEKGILVCPYQEGPLIIFKKQKNKIEKTYTREEYVFVPLIIS